MHYNYNHILNKNYQDKKNYKNLIHLLNFHKNKNNEKKKPQKNLMIIIKS